MSDFIEYYYYYRLGFLDQQIKNEKKNTFDIVVVVDPLFGHTFIFIII